MGKFGIKIDFNVIYRPWVEIFDGCLMVLTYASRCRGKPLPSQPLSSDEHRQRSSPSPYKNGCLNSNTRGMLAIQELRRSMAEAERFVLADISSRLNRVNPIASRRRLPDVSKLQEPIDLVSHVSVASVRSEIVDSDFERLTGQDRSNKDTSGRLFEEKKSILQVAKPEDRQSLNPNPLAHFGSKMIQSHNRLNNGKELRHPLKADAQSENEGTPKFVASKSINSRDPHSIRPAGRVPLGVKAGYNDNVMTNSRPKNSGASRDVGDCSKTFGLGNNKVLENPGDINLKFDDVSKSRITLGIRDGDPENVNHKIGGRNGSNVAAIGEEIGSIETKTMIKRAITHEDSNEKIIQGTKSSVLISLPDSIKSDDNSSFGYKMAPSATKRKKNPTEQCVGCHLVSIRDC